MAVLEDRGALEPPITILGAEPSVESLPPGQCRASSLLGGIIPRREYNSVVWYPADHPLHCIGGRGSLGWAGSPSLWRGWAGAACTTRDGAEERTASAPSGAGNTTALWKTADGHQTAAQPAVVARRMEVKPGV
eukprot:GGOE01009209.1.p3 GENE.GGOE01009209.1~~GGOE01009209.1.p3  ORF type:complete len:134 (-),score=1.08 GGOE01009209.1:2-403(-)